MVGTSPVWKRSPLKIFAIVTGGGAVLAALTSNLVLLVAPRVGASADFAMPAALLVLSVTWVFGVLSAPSIRGAGVVFVVFIATLLLPTIVLYALGYRPVPG